MATVVPAEGVILERVLEVEHAVSPEGLSREAYAKYPVYEWLLGRLRGRKALAAISTLLLLLVMAPLLAVLGAAANETLRVTETIRPRLQQLVDQPGEFDSRLRTPIPGCVAKWASLLSPSDDKQNGEHLRLLRTE